MRKLSNLLGFFALAFVVSGCSDDCAVYCQNQAAFIDTCLPQFSQTWSDVGDGYEGQGAFAGQCTSDIEAHIEEDIGETCEGASEETRGDCEDTVRQGNLAVCGDHLNDFRDSCTDYWVGALDFLPGAYDPEPIPEGDDDDSAGDDDDSAGDDDDSAGDDDDSAGDDDDATGDDDDATGDDDDSAGDDDDSAGDDDDSAGDDDDSA